MSGAEGVLVLNIAVASLFAAAYAVIALANPSQRVALVFTASYLIGMLAPASDLLLGVSDAPETLEWLSYASFLVATLSISVAFNLYRGRRPPWILLALVLAAGLAGRAAIWSWPRDTLAYGAVYQAPFALAAVLATRTVLIINRRNALHMALAAVFGALALNFLTKPFLALAFDAGRTLRDYTDTAYALVSQASSGVLLLAAGLILLLIVAQEAIGLSEAASETDPLSGLANRRGFERAAEAAIARAVRQGLPVSAAVFDLDHFKRVNDTLGHAAGDEVICAFARVLRQACPANGVAARTGGEEFVLLLEGGDLQGAVLVAEAVRTATAAGLGRGLPPMTTSGGVAQLSRGEGVTGLLRRADAAAYEAKASGRDRICRWDPREAMPTPAPRPEGPPDLRLVHG
jgi:diguanylate cyclase (GGDEF)-like protein